MRFEAGDLLADGGEVLIFCAEFFDVGADLLSIGEHFIEAGAGDAAGVFVDEAVDQIEAVVDVGEFGGVEVELVDVTAEGESGVVEGGGGVFDLRGNVLKRLVQLGEFEEHRERGAEAFDDGAFLFVKSAIGGAGGAFYFFEVGKKAAAGGEFFVLAGDGLGVVDFFGLEFVEFQLLAAEGAGGGELVLLSEEDLALMEEFGELLAEVCAVRRIRR